MIPTDCVESTSVASCAAEGVLVATDSKGRLRISREQRKAVLARFERSGMSGAKFAAVAGIKYSTFAGWLQRYRRAKPKAALRRLRLLEAVVDPGQSQERASEPVLRVHLSGQVWIEVSTLAQVPLVVELIRTLRSRPAGC
jgi:DNA-binding transcriptional regulator YiaG